MSSPAFPSPSAAHADPMLTQLRTACSLPLAVVGVGNPMKGDDGFGPAVVAALPEIEGVACFDAGMAPENWLAPIARSAPASILLLDAADMGEPPGTLRLLAPGELDAVATSTHGLPLGFFLGLLAGRCDAPARVLAAQPASLALGAPVSEPVQAAIRRAAALVQRLARTA